MRLITASVDCGSRQAILNERFVLIHIWQRWLSLPREYTCREMFASLSARLTLITLKVPGLNYWTLSRLSLLKAEKIFALLLWSYWFGFEDRTHFIRSRFIYVSCSLSDFRNESNSDLGNPGIYNEFCIFILFLTFENFENGWVHQYTQWRETHKNKCQEPLLNTPS